ncbi:MAG TPA: SDR family oxidoreductase, partial [Jatrophihabitantaceae bacterium]|nr:SDR family oxidoreductase [Jatrophihabitantaceae bacterium]
MAYFVTGATGFIGRFLMADLLKRDGTIYVLCRASSLDKLDELRERLGTDDQRVVAVIGDLSKDRLGVDADEIDRLDGQIGHFFHLAAIYDLTADADSQHVANVEGTRHALHLAEAVHAEHFHMVSSIAAAGLYKGTFTEDMFDEAEHYEHNPYYLTKHVSEGVVRDEAKIPWRIYRPG